MSTTYDDPLLMFQLRQWLNSSTKRSQLIRETKPIPLSCYPKGFASIHQLTHDLSQHQLRRTKHIFESKPKLRSRIGLYDATSTANPDITTSPINSSTLSHSFLGEPRARVDQISVPSVVIVADQSMPVEGETPKLLTKAHG
ncbi:hypothetical protein FHL15_006455 [Xylaria flabelliformis]|uniref:Uncharacterized protein n=1 Tax=Xylaria flabelliformis TaxID=2512241 RepID=A0A553HXV0_9PEZI|nr:hypothetical protein FHL15_006455 [Xylaria flabelliformis]